MCTIELRFGLKLFHEKLNDEKYLGKKLGKYYPFKLISIDRYSVEQLWTHNHQQIKQKKKFILTTVVVYIRGYFLSTYFKMTTICGEESQTRHSFFYEFSKVALYCYLQKRNEYNWAAMTRSGGNITFFFRIS